MKVNKKIITTEEHQLVFNNYKSSRRLKLTDGVVIKVPMFKINDYSPSSFDFKNKRFSFGCKVGITYNDLLSAISFLKGEVETCNALVGKSNGTFVVQVDKIEEESQNFFIIKDKLYSKKVYMFKKDVVVKNRVLSINKRSWGNYICFKGQNLCSDTDKSRNQLLVKLLILKKILDYGYEYLKSIKSKEKTNK